MEGVITPLTDCCVKLCHHGIPQCALPFREQEGTFREQKAGEGSWKAGPHQSFAMPHPCCLLPQLRASKDTNQPLKRSWDLPFQCQLRFPGTLETGPGEKWSESCAQGSHWTLKLVPDRNSPAAGFSFNQCLLQAHPGAGGRKANVKCKDNHSQRAPGKRERRKMEDESRQMV